MHAGWTITFGGQASNMYILLISVLIYRATVKGREISTTVEVLLHVSINPYRIRNVGGGLDLV